jgi:hypothetical protein
MLPIRTSTRPTVGQLARAQTFRFLTMLATWALIFAAFVYEPGWIRDSLRFMTHSIESLADQVPEPWGARLEIMLRELGGMIWIQIATAIVLLRLIVWVPFHIWRLRRERQAAGSLIIDSQNGRSGSATGNGLPRTQGRLRR